ncbi:MAG: tetratricopeptide repeat protein [Saprospiraceae bacterium]|nr:tetratricopeptide repeat protein [Saprospiraceae bacterium]
MSIHRNHLYFPLLIGLFGLVIVAYIYFRPPFWVGFLFLGFWLVASWFVRTRYAVFFKGLNLLNRQQFEAAEVEFLTFLEQLKKSPSVKNQARFWYYGAFTADIEAMTMNNLGVIKMAQEQPGSASAYLQRALQIDQRYAKPHYNLAVMAGVAGDEDLARQHFQKALDLGYGGDTFDQFLQKIVVEYAKTYREK